MAAANEIIKEIINHSLMLRIGSRAVLIIKQRTAEGIFLKGSSPGSSKYSTKPFAMPIGAVRKSDVRLKILKGDISEDAQLFKSKAGKLWVVLKNGYKWLRQQSGKESGKVDLRWSGKLMKSLRVLKADPSRGEIIIGHNDARSKELASWHNQLGAGKSKRLHKYLSLSEKELQSITKQL